MRINYEDENFIGEVETFTKNKLQRKSDLKKLIEISSSNLKEKEFEELAFTAKYVCGVMRVLKKAVTIPEVQSIDHIKEDLSKNLKKVIEQLRSLVLISENDMQEYFEKTYLKLSPDNITNLNQLLSDLELVKKYINHLKRED
jgi:hypothetical protein